MKVKGFTPPHGTSHIWFLSDTHFNHKNIIEYCGRPYPNVQDMNEDLIKKWNSRIQPNDTVYHLGDVCMGEAEKIPEILSRLNGEIYLVRGNHDNERRLKYYREAPNIKEICDIKQLFIGRFVFVLCHYPPLNQEFMEQVNQFNKEIYWLYGHTHENGWLFDSDTNSFNVCVDHTAGYPLNLQTVIDIIGMSRREENNGIQKH